MAPALPAATRMGAVHLTVADLARSVAFYEEVLGLRLHGRDAGGAAVAGEDAAGVARLGTGGEDLLVLSHEPGARPSTGHSGLFHFALLLPHRHQLARALAHYARSRAPLTGMSDHEVSEALYLRDPDGHGIEIYWDRPRSRWEGRVGELMTTAPLDADGLLGELEDPRNEPFDGLPSGTVMGHVHLCVAEVEPVVAFYRDALGFELMAAFGRQAAFLAAGGYHHHLGANTWQSAGRGQPGPGFARLTRATVVVPGAAARDEVASRLDADPEPLADGALLVHDPSGNPIALAA